MREVQRARRPELLHGDKAVPLQGPTPVKVTWSSWDPSWGAFHHEISNGVCGLTTGPGKGFLCGGIQVTFDMPIAFRSMLPSVQHRRHHFGPLIYSLRVISSMPPYTRRLVCPARHPCLVMLSGW